MIDTKSDNGDVKNTNIGFIVSPKEEKLPINLDLNCEFPIDISK